MMDNYLAGTDVCTAPLVDCVERGQRFSRGELIGVDWLTVHSRADYDSAVARLKASADALNQTASSEPGWQSVYQNALALYAKYHDVGFFASINPFGDRTLNDAAWQAIADAQRRVDEFAARVRAKGGVVREPVREPVRKEVTGGGSATFLKVLPWVAAIVAVTGAGIAVVKYRKRA